MSAEEIKKCPFCGEQPKVKNESGYDAGTDIACPNINCEPQPYVFVPCGTVRTPTHKESEQSAIELWNRRTTISMDTAQKLADAVHSALGVGQVTGNSKDKLKAALAQFEREKGGV